MQAMRHDRSWQRVAWQAALLAALLLGFALRLHRLDTASLWLDELGQASVASGSAAQAIAGARLHHGAAPLDYLLTWLALRVAHVDFAARLPAALLGTLTLALTYRLIRRQMIEQTNIANLSCDSPNIACFQVGQYRQAKPVIREITDHTAETGTLTPVLKHSFAFILPRK